MHAGGFYPFPTTEVRRAWRSRHIWLNRYVPIPSSIYSSFLDPVKNKDYFVLTTNSIPATFLSATLEITFTTCLDIGRKHRIIINERKLFATRRLYIFEPGKKYPSGWKREEVKMRKIRRWIVMCLMVLISITAACPVMAVTQTGSIIVNFNYGDKKIPIGGAEFSIAKIAAANYSSGVYVYTMLEPYAAVPCDPNNLTVKEIKTLPDKFLKAGSTPLASKVTDAKGLCAFEGLDPGIYLFWQKSSSGEAKGYKTSIPTIVFLPSNEDASAFVFNVEVYPKTEPIPVTPTVTPSVTPTITPTVRPTATPTVVPKQTTEPSKLSISTSGFAKTGDVSQISIWIILLSLSAFIIAVLAITAHRNKSRKQINDDK